MYTKTCENIEKFTKHYALFSQRFVVLFIDRALRLLLAKPTHDYELRTCCPSHCTATIAYAIHKAYTLHPKTASLQCWLPQTTAAAVASAAASVAAVAVLQRVRVAKAASTKIRRFGYFGGFGCNALAFLEVLRFLFQKF